MTTLLILTLALWSVGWLLTGRFRNREACSAGNKSASNRLSIIIPARNEEHNLPRLLHSIASQSTKPFEIIVVDDHSTDRTADIAQEFGGRLIPSQPLPDGWRGKTWACHQGAQAAKGDWFMFLDADTWFEPEGLTRILDRYPGGAFSVGPYHRIRRPYEILSLFFNFNMTVGTVPDGLFGQLLLTDRESYRRADGHRSVKGRILENFRLAESFRAIGVPVHSTTGRGLFAFRMYPHGLGELVEGWTKGFASGAGQTSRGVLLLVVLWMIGLMLAPIGFLVAGDWLPWGTAYLLCVMQIGWFSRQIGTFGSLAALLYPVPLIFFFAVFARSAVRSGRQVRWKGREIRAD